MSYSAPLELLADAAGSVTYGWVEEGVYFARFSRNLSARLGDAFAARLRAAVLTTGRIKYFADGRALESYDLLARRAFVQVVTEHRDKFDELCLLSWPGGEISPGFVSALGEPVLLTKEASDFEARLLNAAPCMRSRLPARAASPNSRWDLRS